MINLILMIFASSSIVQIARALRKEPEAWTYFVMDEPALANDPQLAEIGLTYVAEILHKSKTYAVALMKGGIGTKATIIPAIDIPSPTLGPIDNLLLCRAILEYIKLSDSDAQVTL